jgi:single-stranded DNA-binding protein
MERNRIEFTGTVERFRSIPTKTGVQMAKFLLKVGDSRFGCVAFGNLAAVVLAAGEGKEIGLVGQGAINSWKTDDGAWRNDFQVAVWSVEIDGVATHFEKSQGVTRKSPRSEEQPSQQGPPPQDEFDYQGGPF